MSILPTYMYIYTHDYVHSSHCIMAFVWLVVVFWLLFCLFVFMLFFEPIALHRIGVSIRPWSSFLNEVEHCAWLKGKPQANTNAEETNHS